MCISCFIELWFMQQGDLKVCFFPSPPLEKGKRWGHPLWRQLKHLNNRKVQRDPLGTAPAGRTGSDVGVRAADVGAARRTGGVVLAAARAGAQGSSAPRAACASRQRPDAPSASY